MHGSSQTFVSKDFESHESSQKEDFVGVIDEEGPTKKGRTVIQASH